MLTKIAITKNKKMAEDNISKGAGIIPDFFHDIIAYILPGYTALIIGFINYSIITNKGLEFTTKINFSSISILFIVAYVIGRFLEQLGKVTIHNKVLPSFKKKNSPKYALLFEEKNKKYSTEFKKNLTKKIDEWTKTTLGEDFLDNCKKENKDDYFNLIQFYLRERFPAVALYEKKQNATIVLTRSLTLLFFLNVIIHFAILFCLTEFKNVEFSKTGFLWICSSLIFSWTFYSRFKQDQEYHAMYIFENFIATKKLLSKPNKDKED